MPDVSDYELFKSKEPPPSRSRIGLWATVAVILVAAIVAFYVYWHRRPAPPPVAAWLATEDLIRDFTIGVANVAQGNSAARQLTVLRPSSNFRVIKRGNDIAIDPRSYDRYDTLAAAAASMNAAGSARLYATLKPRIEEAARELGDSSFDRTLERALVQLLSAPAVNDPILLQSKGIGFGFA